MVRVPSWWRGAVSGGYAQGLYVPGSSVAARRIDITPLAAYRNRVDVDLGNDGIAPQAVFPGFLALSGGPVSAPAAFSNIIFASPPTVPPGTYLIAWTVTLGGTVGAGDANNFGLYANGTLAATSVNAGAVGSYPQTAVQVTLGSGAGNLKILSGGNAGTAGSTYSASIAQNLGIPGTAVAQIGPTGWGVSWALDQASLSTSVGVLDPAQCTLYVGPLAIPFYQVVTGLAGGGSQFGLGGVGLADGWFVFAVWTGGTPGQFAYLRVTGVKTALTQ